MKNWFKTMLCAVSAATLVACGGGDYVDPNPAAGGGGGGGGGGASSDAIAGLGTQGFVVANFAIGGAVDGMLIPAPVVAFVPASLESPADAPDPMDISDRCMPGGEASQTEVEPHVYEIVYTNCVGVDSDVKYNGTVTVREFEDTAGTGYTVDFDSTGLQVSLELNGTTYEYIYKNRESDVHAMVLSDIVNGEDGMTKVTSLVNVDITIGTGSVTLEDYKLEFDRTSSPETIALSGKYSVMLKPSDFGPVPAGLPDVAFPLTFVTSTDPILTIDDADEFSGGTLKLKDSNNIYEIATNFTTKKVTITVSGIATTYDF